MPSYLHPGVYIEEVAGGARPIEAVGTSTTAFVGMAERGPLNTPVFLTKFTEFEENFGRYIDDKSLGRSYLAYAVYQFFQNGGAACYVVRVEAGPEGDDPESSAIGLLTDGGEPTLTVKAATPGEWGNRLRVAIGPGTTSDTGFDMQVFEGDDLVESFNDLSMVDSDPSFVDRMTRDSVYIQTSASSSLSDNPVLIGKVDIGAGVNLTVVNKIRLQIDKHEPITIDCSEVASTASSVTADEIAQAINNAFEQIIKEGVASVVNGHVQIKSPTANADSQIVLTEPGKGDATYEIFGLQESRWRVNAKSETLAQAFGRLDAAGIHTALAASPTISLTLGEGSAVSVPLAQGADAPASLFGALDAINAALSADPSVAYTDGEHVVLNSDEDIQISQADAAVILGADFFSYSHTVTGDEPVKVEGDAEVSAADGDVKLKIDDHPSFVVTVESSDSADDIADRINETFGKLSKSNKKIAAVVGERLTLTSLKKGSNASIVVASHMGNPVAGDLFGTAHQNADNFLVPAEKQSVARLDGERDFSAEPGEEIGSDLGNQTLRLSIGGDPVQFTTGSANSTLQDMFTGTISALVDLNYRLLTDGNTVYAVAASTTEKPELHLSIPLNAGLHVTEGAPTLNAYKRLFGELEIFNAPLETSTKYVYSFGLPNNNPSQTYREEDRDDLVSKYLRLSLPLSGGTHDRSNETALVVLTTDTGLHSLDKLTDISLLVIPGWEKMSELAAKKFIDEGTGYCDKVRPNAARPVRDLFFIASTPSYVQKPTDAKNFVRNEISTVSSGGYSALYYPWINVMDPIGTKSPTVAVPPSGAIAGLYANIDRLRGVWKAPAGTEAGVAGVVKLETQVSDVEQNLLNPHSVNAIRRMPGAGIVSWGARTLHTNPEWKYVPVRRTAIMIEVSIYENIQWAVFEPNNDQLWGSLRLSIGSFMNGLFRSGAFQGTSSSEAYFVNCGLGDTMTQGDIDRGQVIVQVGFAPLKPAEFVIIRIQQKAGQEQ